MENKFGIYIHIPFCKSKCYYCDFASYAGKEDSISLYFDALLDEIKADTKTHQRTVSTVYFGGGTPSHVDLKYISKTLEELNKYYNIKNNAEITLEINPGTIDKQKLDNYKKIGINRISIGLQSTNDEELKRIGRTHLYKDFIKTFNIVRKAGFDNINVDLMFSLPGQSKKDLLQNLKKIINLADEQGGIKHISLYSLILEEGTALYKYYKNNNITQDDKLDREMYHSAVKMLEDNGFYRYEVSNFSKRGFESRHNTDCWEYSEYRGFGSGASSFIENERFKNNEDVDKYIKYISQENSPVAERDILNKQQEIEDYIMLGLRMQSGFNISKFEEKFNIPFNEYYKEELKILAKEGLIILDNNIRLTDRGFDVMNSVITYFFK